MSAASTRSMTGTGSAAGPSEVGELRIELRAVNGRGMSLKQRLCAELSGLEGAIEDEVRKVVRRGSVTLVVDRFGAGGVAQDRAQLQRLVADLRALARDLGVADDLSLRDVLAIAGSNRGGAPGRELPAGVTALLRAALADFEQHRAADGAAAVAAMREELAALEALRQQAAARAPAIVDDHRERLLQRVRDFVAAQGAQVGAADVVREVALFAERVDTSEELQRLGAHCAEVRALLDAGGSIGRKLDFLLQEVLREANTLGSKSPDVETAHCVVAMKAAIDRLKEQAANLE
ncbi:MAG: YicC family protein [Planctomycetota bacterium]